MSDDTAKAARLLLIVSDGVRPEVLTEEIEAGHTPALAGLRERGGLHTVSTSFPSVTGPAYAPFVMGRQPANIGIPGLRWYDRARSLRWSPGQARSYAGIDIWHMDGDIASHAPTMLELAQPSLAAMSMIGRGATHGRIGRSVAWMARAAPSHFRGNHLGWRTVERQATAAFLKRFGAVRPRFSILAITSPDKFAHAYGHRSEAVRTSLRDLDSAVAQAQAIAQRGGWHESLHIWMVGDHGHAPVASHDDLHGWFENQGMRVLAHPQLSTRNADVALMVGGNAMAHVYLSPGERLRRWWPSHQDASQVLLEQLVQRPSVDIAAVALDAQTVRLWHATRGVADIVQHRDPIDPRWSYVPHGGDPLAIGGTLERLDASAAWEAMATGPYPDAITQLSQLVVSPRGGDIVLSATEGWDLRSRFEPTTHVSTHGALLRDQMLVPLLIDTPVTRVPQRSTDVVPSALDLLGITTNATFDGRSFLR